MPQRVVSTSLIHLGRHARTSRGEVTGLRDDTLAPLSKGRTARGFLARAVRSTTFDWIICALISLNALSIGIQTDYMATNLTPDVPIPLRLIETGFCALFTCEILLRIYVYRCSFFIGPGWHWNIFDCCVIGMQIVEEVLAWIVTDQMELLQGVGISRLVRFVRRIRMLRLLRILRLVRELRMLVVSISSSLRPFGWTVALLMIMIFVVSLFITQMVADLRITTEDTADQVEVLRHYYGSLARCMLSLFEAITGGVDWDEIMVPLGQEEFHIARFVFLLYVAFSLFAIMNVVTGLFIESVLRHAKADKENYLINSAYEIFKAVDGGVDGQLTWEDFEDKLETTQMKAFFREMDINESQAKGLFCLLDLDGSETINLHEFLSGCLKLRGPAKALDTAVIIEEMTRWAGSGRV